MAFKPQGLFATRLGGQQQRRGLDGLGLQAAGAPAPTAQGLIPPGMGARQSELKSAIEGKVMGNQIAADNARMQRLATAAGIQNDAAQMDLANRKLDTDIEQFGQGLDWDKSKFGQGQRMDAWKTQGDWGLRGIEQVNDNFWKNQNFGLDYRKFQADTALGLGNLGLNEKNAMARIQEAQAREAGRAAESGQRRAYQEKQLWDAGNKEPYYDEENDTAETYQKKMEDYRAGRAKAFAGIDAQYGGAGGRVMPGEVLPAPAPGGLAPSAQSSGYPAPAGLNAPDYIKMAGAVAGLFPPPAASPAGAAGLYPPDEAQRIRQQAEAVRAGTLQVEPTSTVRQNDAAAMARLAPSTSAPAQPIPVQAPPRPAGLFPPTMRPNPAPPPGAFSPGTSPRLQPTAQGALPLDRAARTGNFGLTPPPAATQTPAPAGLFPPPKPMGPLETAAGWAANGIDTLGDTAANKIASDIDSLSDPRTKRKLGLGLIIPGSSGFLR